MKKQALYQNMLKKAAAAAAAGILGLSLLAGCGSTEAVSSATSRTQESISVSEISKENIGGKNAAAGTDSGDMQETVPETSVDISGMDLSIESGSDSESSGISLDGEYTVTSGGTYTLSGEISGMVVVDAGDADVQLILDGVSIMNENGPAIYIRSADNVTISLKDGTVNTLSDGSNYVKEDSGSTLDAAVFSKADLCLNGSGTLYVNGNYKHGIVSKDDLTVASGTLYVKSEGVSLNGKDSVKIGAGANITLEAGSDGIRSDNDSDEEKGYVYIEGGILSITAANDGIQAETVLLIEDGTIDITAGGGASGKNLSSEESYKGLKAGTAIVLNSGSASIDSADDSIHANGTVEVNGGTFVLRSGDDGIHADEALVLNGGEITVEKSYEGFESTAITVNGGTYRITASDDGLNAAGGADGSGNAGFFGREGFGSSGGTLTLNGGTVYVNAGGDGLDANGTLEMNGGTVYVDGPENNGNGALDYDGTAVLTGGTLIASGSAGMAMNFSSSEGQASILVSVGNASAGTSFELQDEDGSTIASFTPEKAYQTVVVTAPSVQVGGTYKILLNGKEYTSVAVTSSIMNSGVNSMGGFGGMGGQKGGMSGSGRGPMAGGNSEQTPGENQGSSPGERIRRNPEIKYN